MADGCGAPTFGFLFAFKVYSRGADGGGGGGRLVEAAVTLLSASDVIHVALVPVVGHARDADGGTELLAADTAFTAVLGAGFVEHPAEECLGPAFAAFYLPLPAAAALRGLALLLRLRGKGYNYGALPLLAVMPRWWKARGRGCGCCGGCCGCAAAAPEEVDFDPASVICSQVGLLVCHACGAVPGGSRAEELDPARCTPGELYDALLEGGRAHAWSTAAVRVRPDVSPDGALHGLTLHAAAAAAAA